MGPNADRAIQLLRDAADDEPREAYVFEPEGPVEGVAHFIGGAALGTFPQVAYKALLTRVAQKCSLAVVATPFDLGLDHDAAARTCRTAFRAEAARWRAPPPTPRASSLFAWTFSECARLHSEQNRRDGDRPLSG